MPDFINKVIEIKSKEEKKTKTGTNTTITIKDQDGLILVWWKTIKDGSLSQVQQQFKNMQLDEGSIIQVSYVIEEYTGSDGKQHFSNKVTGFRETNEQPVIGQSPAPRPQAVKNTSPQPKYSPVSEDKQTDWDKIAVGKVQSLFLQAYLQSGKTFSEAKLQVIPARQLAELVVYGQQTGKADEPLPTETPLADEIAQNIPF